MRKRTRTRPSGPDPALFPRSQAARTMTEILRRLPAAELGYTGPWGVAALRRQLESHLGRLRAAMAPADGIVVEGSRLEHRVAMLIAALVELAEVDILGSFCSHPLEELEMRASESERPAPA